MKPLLAKTVPQKMEDWVIVVMDVGNSKLLGIRDSGLLEVGLRMWLNEEPQSTYK